ncbi:MAG: hypothetical protein AAGF47_07225, partial [Planctomycetota bacterium]
SACIVALIAAIVNGQHDTRPFPMSPNYEVSVYDTFFGHGVVIEPPIGIASAPNDQVRIETTYHQAEADGERFSVEYFVRVEDVLEYYQGWEVDTRVQSASPTLMTSTHTEGPMELDYSTLDIVQPGPTLNTIEKQSVWTRAKIAGAESVLRSADPAGIVELPFGARRWCG